MLHAPTDSRAAYWHQGKVTTLPGIVDPWLGQQGAKTVPSWRDEAHAISHTGVVAGSVGWFGDGDFPAWPVLWIHGKPRVLPKLPYSSKYEPVPDHYVVKSVNRAKTAVGWGWVSGRLQGHDYLQRHENNPDARAAGYTRALVWVNGTVKDVGWGKLFGINNRGDFAGQLGRKAVLWRGGKPTVIVDGRATAISSNGIVVGDEGSVEPGCDFVSKQGFQWQNDKRILLRALPGFAECWINGVNHAGWAVGESHTDSFKDDYKQQATLWIATTPYKLASLVQARAPFSLRSALAINNKGQILCEGAKGYFLLTPTA